MKTWWHTRSQIEKTGILCVAAIVLIAALVGAKEVSKPDTPILAAPGHSSTTTGKGSSTTTGENAGPGGKTATNEAGAPTWGRAATPTTDHDHEATPTTDHDHEATTTTDHDHEATTTTDHDHHGGTSTTAAPTTTVADSNGGTAGSELSGSVCATVTGEATLVGKVELTCDLVVSGAGAVLIARSGVDVDGNGFQILIEKGASADFQGTKTSTWSNDGLTQNRQRDAVFSDLRRIMFHDGAGASVIRYVAVLDSGTGALGDYPLHWHLNGDTTRGTLVEGVVVANSAHHAFVPHGSHGITFRDTMAFDIGGEAYWWDRPGSNGCNTDIKKLCTLDNSNDITYDHVLAHTITNSPADAHQGLTLAGFELGAGSGNVVRDSVARNINPTQIKNCSGFHWPSAANQNRGGNRWVFEDNATFESECHGIFVWQNDLNDHVITRFRGDGVIHGAYKNRYEYRDTHVPYLVGRAIGWSWTGGSIDLVTMGAHVNTGEIRFIDVDIGTFVVRDSGGDMPATYILDGTGQTCDSIVYQSIMAGSQVIIDGVTCPIP